MLGVKYYIVFMYSAALDDNIVFYDGSSVSAQDLLGPVTSMSTISRMFSCCILATNLENK